MPGTQSPQPRDDIMISRALTQADMSARSRYRLMRAARVFAGVIGIYLVFVALLWLIVEDLTTWTGTLIVVGVVMLITAGVSVALGAAMSKRILRDQLGASQVQTALWSSDGLTLTSENSSLATAWAEMRDISRRGQVWVVRTRAFSHVLSEDFVTPAVLDRARAAGVTVR